MDPISALERVFTLTCDAHGCRSPALLHSGFCLSHTRQLEAFKRDVDKQLSPPPATDRPARSR